MSYCTSCRTELHGGQSFCTSCGASSPIAPSATDPEHAASPDTVAFGASPAAAAPAGWYDDGTGRSRYWDGRSWTDQVGPPVAPAVAPGPQRPAQGANPWPAVLAVLGVLALAGLAVAGYLVFGRDGNVATTAAAPQATTAAPSTAATQLTPPPPSAVKPIPPTATTPLPTTPPPVPVAPVPPVAPVYVGPVDYSAVATESAAAEVASSFATYFNGINTGSYYDAFTVLSPAFRSQRKLTVEGWSSGLHTTTDTGIKLLRLRPTADGVATTVAFTSRQAAKDGYRRQTCTRWVIDYTLSRSYSVGPPYVIETVKHRSIRAC